MQYSVLFVFIAILVLAQFHFELKNFKILIRILAKLCTIMMHKEDLPPHETCHFLEQNRPLCNLGIFFGLLFEASCSFLGLLGGVHNLRRPVFRIF